LIGEESVLTPAAAAMHSGGLVTPLSPTRTQNSPSCPPDRFIPRRKDSPNLHLSMFAHKPGGSLTGTKASPSNTANGQGDMIANACGLIVYIGCIYLYPIAYMHALKT
jgi:hypothetical protein